ncbi:hypothetical protein ES703_99628 [subsurface metagenome]
MDIRGLIANCLQQNQIQQLFDGIRLGQFLQFIQVNTLVPAFKFRKETVSLYFIYQFVYPFFFFPSLIVLSQSFFQRLRVGYLRGNSKPHQCAQVVGCSEIIGTVKDNAQLVLLFIVFDWDNVICLCHLSRHLIDHIRWNVNVVQFHIFHSPLRRKSNLQLPLIYQAKLKEYLAYLHRLGPLFLDYQAFVNFLSGQNTHFYKYPAKGSAS